MSMQTPETPQSHFASFDLHSNNAFNVIIDPEKKIIFKRKFKNNLDEILQKLEKYRPTLRGIVVESTYNWYWLVDGLMANGYKVHLAHTVETAARSNKKYSDDYRDAFHLADLLRKGDLAEGYIYPKEERPLRDLLRKRGMLVRSRTRHLLSLVNLINRHLGIQMTGSGVKSLSPNGVDQLFDNDLLRLAARSDLAVIKTLTIEIKRLEKAILKAGKLKENFKVLLTVPGIGDIIGLSICLEVGDIKRFGKAGEYVSYCRCVPSGKYSNEKKKGEGNRKNGNKYLKWAYIEAANFTIRYCPHARAFFHKKLKKLNQNAKRTIALNAVAAKLARAHYHMLKKEFEYDPEKLFGPAPAPAPKTELEKQKKRKTNKGCDSQPKRGLEKPTV